MKLREKLPLIAFFAVAAVVFGMIGWSTGAQQKRPIAQGGDTRGKQATVETAISDDMNMIMLNSRQIDTRSEPNLKGQNVSGEFSGKRMKLVKYSGPIEEKSYNDLSRSGVQIVDYIPNFTYLVYGDSASVARVMRSANALGSPIDWIGDYTSEDRLQPGVYRQTGERPSERAIGTESGYYTIQLVADEDANRSTLERIGQLVTEKPKELVTYRHYVATTVRMTPEGVEEISRHDDVISIHPYVEPEKMDERQNMILAGNLTGGIPNTGDYFTILSGWGFTQSQFNASGFLVDVADDGADRNPNGADPGSIPQDSYSGPVSARHFVLYEGGLRNIGETTPTGVSRFLFKGRWGTGSVSDGGLGVSGHGQLNMSIVGGFVPSGSPFNTAPHADVSGYRYSLGVAPFVRMSNSVIFDPGFTTPNIPNMISAVYANGARISSNSWGSNAAGAYTVNSQVYDGLVRDAQSGTAGNQQMILTFSAGNAGSGAQTIGAPATAKNVITVGAAESVHPFGGADGCGVGDTDTNNANDIVGFSSRGPTSDGRYKPDIQAPGTHITGMAYVTNGATGNGTADPGFRADGVCGGVAQNWFPAGQTWYTASSGTSHSNPAVAGGAALLYQQFINNPSYISAYRLPVGNAPPSPAMTKAYLVNSTRYMNGVGANDNLPSNNQGMGMMNLGTAFDGVQRIIHDQVPVQEFSVTGQTSVITGTVSDTTKPFRVTLAYTDAPGSTTGNAFVNNLDLTVSIGGNTYKGNVFTGDVSSTGGSADLRNNVESVFLPAGFPVGTPFSVSVKATNISGDGIPGNADSTDQDFALVVYNGNTAVIPYLSNSGQTLTAESCLPANGAPDPGETVTVDLAVTNSGVGSSAGNVIGVLQATGGVTSPSAAQNYGTLAPTASASRSFTFTVDPNAICGNTITLTLALSDDNGSLGTVTYTYTVGTPVVSLAENFDGVSAPAIPANWTAATTGGTAWATQTSTPDTSPNSVFAANPASVTDNILTSPLIYASSQSSVSFRNSYNTENGFDGGVLEISVNEGAWQDVITAGGSFISGGYNGTINSNPANQSPIPGRPAWTGNSAGYLTTIVGLPNTLTGNFFRLRWRLGTDNAVAGTGWRIDSISVSSGYQCCGQTPAPVPALLTRGNVTASEAPGASNSDSDGFFEPGEVLLLSIPVNNIGSSPATTPTLTLTTTTPNVSIVQGTGNYPTINGASSATVATFAIHLQPAFTAFATVNLTATINYGGGPAFSEELTVPSSQSISSFSIATSCPLSAPNTVNFSNTTAIAIPGTVASGTQPASPYPSNIAVSGLVGNITKVTATINGYTHAFPSDVDIVLVGPGGQSVILMSDVGGTMSGRTFTFDDAAASTLPSSGVSGTYRPTNVSSSDTFPAPGPGGLTQAAPALSAFNTLSPNGTWSLYVVDDFGSSDNGTFAGGWSLSITTQLPNCSTSATGPTAAGVSVSGRILNSEGQGIRNATVTITDSQGISQTVISGSSGMYRFESVAVGEQYTVAVKSTRYSFVPRLISVDDVIEGLDFTSQ